MQIGIYRRCVGKEKTVLNQIDSTSYPINDIFVALKNAEPVGCTLTNIEFKIIN